MMPGPFHPRFEDLPPVLPVFPLQGAILLPWGKLPLNVFEPRYLAMVQDALGLGRMIGMIQPRRCEAKVEAGAGSGDPIQAPRPLYDVGCAGRISSFSETDDGRLMITLTGLARFTVTEERSGHRGYRMVAPDYTAYRADLDPPPNIILPRKALMAALTAYVAREELPMTLSIFDDLKAPDLVTALCMVCPFDVAEKQALVEAPSLDERARMLLALLEMAAYPAGSPQSRQ